MSKRKHLVFQCPLATCKQKVGVHNTVEYPPWCFGKEGTHSKQMQFLPDESVGEPDYNWQKQKA